jgi:hypothetical protein
MQFLSDKQQMYIHTYEPVNSFVLQAMALNSDREKCQQTVPAIHIQH